MTFTEKDNYEPIAVLYGPPPSFWEEEKPVLVFDLGGVLLNIAPQRCMNEFTKLMGEERMSQILGLQENGEGKQVTEGEQQDRLVSHKETHSLMLQYERGEISTDEFIDQLLPLCHEGTGRRYVVEAWNSMLRTIPQSRIERLIDLRDRGYKMYLLSNTNELHWNYVADAYPQLKRLFKHCFLSFEMHKCKPEKEMFEVVQERVGVTDPRKLIFVDDLRQNREAAAALGWRTASSIEDLDYLL